MFTGLVQSLAPIRSVVEDGQQVRHFVIERPADWDAIADGESIAVNGCCLTIVKHDATSFFVQAGPETILKTNLGSLKNGDRVNLERALRVGDRLGGHFVTGHIDAVGTIAERVLTGEWETVWFTMPETLGELLVAKGSIAVDGVSLTVVEAERTRFCVMLIPHTLAHTTLGFKIAGDVVNLETDLLAKHVQKLFQNLSVTI